MHYRLQKFFLFIFILNAANYSNAYPNHVQTQVHSTRTEIAELYETYYATGICRLGQSRSYRASNAGKIDFVTHLQGKQLKQGDLILSIDKELAQATKTQAEAAFKTAELSYERDKSLFAKKIISHEVLENSKVNFEAARLNLQKAIQTYENMVIVAPFNGEVGAIKFKLGDEVKPGEYLVSIISNSEKIVFLELPETLYGRVSNNSDIYFSDSFGKEVKGEITAVSSYLSDNGTITLNARITEENNFAPGSYIKAKILIGKHQGLAIKERAIMKNNQGNFVYLIDNNVAKQTYIKLGMRTGDLIEVISGLKQGDQIILDGLTKIQNGSKVQIIE